MTTATATAPRKEERKREKVAKAVMPVMERAMVVAHPHNFFISAPRDELMRQYGAEARYTPVKVGSWRLLATVGALVGTALLSALLFLPLLTTMSFNDYLGLVQLAAIMGGMGMFVWGFPKFIVPRFYALQPLWCLMLVEYDYEWKPVFIEMEDGEGNAINIPVDIEVTATKLEKAEVLPLTPRALLLEAQTTGAEKETGILRADYLYLALNPSDVINWFKTVESRLGFQDAVIGGGYVIAALIAVFLFVNAQGG